MSETKALKEIIKIRLKKRKVLIEREESPYSMSFKKSHSALNLLENFDEFVKKRDTIFLRGRLMSLRQHGKLTFGNIKDSSGTMQIAFREDRLGKSAYAQVEEFADIGDFLGLEGMLFTTKKGEKTLEVKKYKIISKSIRPLPEKWHGLKDVEQRYRKRYLDILMNEDARKVFESRSGVVSECRKFLEKQGFKEVETPILQTIPGGASARPFETRLSALNMDMYLRIAPELYLKRLLVGGMEKVYEIGRNFRNEGLDYSHNPEFTMLEFYWAYSDYKEGMKLTEKLIRRLVKNVLDTDIYNNEGKKISFTSPWQRIEFGELLQKYAGVNYEEFNFEALQNEAKKLGVDIKKKVHSKAEVADIIYKKYCLPKITEPTFVIHHPVEMMPLAKSLQDKPAYTASFQLIIAGWELVKGYSELNDPVKQRKLFEEQEKLRKKGDDEAQFMDEDFIEALEYGMPPAFGFGMGIDRITAFLTGSHALRETILFPTMKPQ